MLAILVSVVSTKHLLPTMSSETHPVPKNTVLSFPVPEFNTFLLMLHTSLTSVYELHKTESIEKGGAS